MGKRLEGPLYIHFVRIHRSIHLFIKICLQKNFMFLKTILWKQRMRKKTEIILEQLKQSNDADNFAT